MFLLKSINFFVVCAAFFCQACGFWQNSEDQNTNASTATFATENSKSEIPFASKEPDVYQAEIVLTNYSSGEKSERKIFTARNGAKIRCDYENEISFLQTSENEKFLINKDKKIYAETRTNSGVSNETGSALKDFLTTEWLNVKPGATFEKLGAENNLTKYRMRLRDAPNANSETLIYIDENLKIPVKQEFFAANGEQKFLVFSMEMRNLKLEADDKLFELPKDFRKVSLNEFQKSAAQKAKLKNE